MSDSIYFKIGEWHFKRTGTIMYQIFIKTYKYMYINLYMYTNISGDGVN